MRICNMCGWLANDGIPRLLCPDCDKMGLDAPAWMARRRPATVVMKPPSTRTVELDADHTRALATLAVRASRGAAGDPVRVPWIA